MAPSDRFELFAETREAIVEDLLRELAGPVRDIAADLEAAAARWGVARDRQALLEAARSLRDGARGWLDTVGRAFGDRALRCLDVASRGAGAEGGGQDDAARWRLLDESQLDTQILVGDLAQLIREAVGPAYPVFGGRIAWMTQHRWPNDDGQPLGARTFAHAVCASLRAAVLEPVPRSVLRGAILKRLPTPLAAVITATNDRLKRLGVPALAPEEPAAAAGAQSAETAGAAPMRGAEQPASAGQRPVTAAGAPIEGSPTAAAQTGGAPAEGTAAEGTAASDTTAGDTTASATTAQDAAARGATAPDTPEAAPHGQAVGQSALMGTVHDVRSLDSSPLGHPTPAGQLRVTPTLQPVIEIERDAVAFAHSTDTVPYSREARHALFRNIRDRIREAGATPAQLSVVDIVSAMFDYVVDDRRLPEASKPLVWRLHQPAIVLSLLDPGYLGDEPRSLRKLIEHFGAISTAFADEMGKGSELHRRLETVVRAVEIVASALQTRSAVMARQVEHEYSRASRSVTQLIERVVNERQSLEAAPGRRNRRDYRRRPNREQEREVSERLRERLNERIAQYQVPDSVKDFLLNVWLRHLRTAALRDGEDSTEFKVAMEVVDNLLWSLDGDKARHYSRRELAERIPPLTRLLASGLRDIGARDDEYKPFFDELFLVHLRKMQPRSSQSAEYLAHPVRGEPAATDVPVLDDQVRVDTQIGAARPTTITGGASPTQTPKATDKPAKSKGGATQTRPTPPIATAGSTRTSPPTAATTGPARAASSGTPATTRPASAGGTGATPTAPAAAPAARAPGPAAASKQAGAAAGSAPGAGAGPAAPGDESAPPRDAPAAHGDAPAAQRAVGDAAADPTMPQMPTPGDVTRPMVSGKPTIRRGAGRTPAGDDTTRPLPAAAPTQTAGAAAPTTPPPAAAPLPAASSTPATPPAAAASSTATPPSAAVPSSATAAPSSATEPSSPEASDQPAADPHPTEPLQAVTAPPTDDPIVVTAPVPVPIRRSIGAEEADRAAHKLREVLSSLDLADLPTLAATRPLPVEEALTAVRRGDWLKFTSATSSSSASFAKVAWINQRRTIVLLVRHPDRKAVSIGMRELRARFEQGRVHLVEQRSASATRRSR